jgi:hypothetical protein
MCLNQQEITLHHLFKKVIFLIFMNICLIIIIIFSKIIIKLYFKNYFFLLIIQFIRKNIKCNYVFLNINLILQIKKKHNFLLRYKLLNSFNKL